MAAAAAAAAAAVLWTVEYRHMEVDTWIVEYEPMDVRNYGLHLEVATTGDSYWKNNWWVTVISSSVTGGTAGGSYWKSDWWVTAISSSLTGGSPRRAVLIGKAVGGSPRFRRLLRVGRHGGRFLLEKPLVGHRDFVVSYSGWHAAERDDETTRQQQQQQQQILAVVHPPPHIRTWKT